MIAPPPGKFFRLLRSRGFRLALLAFQFLWLNVIVPGHRRGVIALPGMECSACEAQAPKPMRTCCAQHSSKAPTPAPVDPADRCAICFFAARLSQAVSFDFTHPPLQFVGMRDMPPTVVGHCPQFASTYLGRAPPALA